MTDRATAADRPPLLARRVNALLEQVQDLRRRLESDIDRPEVFLSSMDRLLAFVRDCGDREVLAAFEARPEFAAHREFFGRCVLRFACMMEGRAHAELMAVPVRNGPVGTWLGPRVEGQYARMEELSRMVDFAACRRFVMTGCGRLPASLLFLHDRTAVPDLFGVDNDPEAAAMARALAARWRLDRLRIEHADAAAISYEPFDVIYWDPFATPRRRVMERILETARPDAVVVLREPFAAGALLLERAMPYLDPRFVVTDESEGYPGRFMLKHVILRQANPGAGGVTDPA